MGKLSDIWRRFAHPSEHRALRKHRLRRGDYPRWLAIGVGLLVWLCLLLMVGPIPTFKFADLKVGERWLEQDLYTPFPLRIVDSERMKEEERILRERHPKVFVYDDTVEAWATQTVHRLLTAAAQVGDSKTSLNDFVRETARTLGIELSPRAAEVLITHAKDARLRADLEQLLHALFYDRGITDDRRLLQGAYFSNRLVIVRATAQQDVLTTFPISGVLEYPEEVQNYLRGRLLSRSAVPESWKELYAEIVSQLARPNLRYSAELTNQRLEAELRKLRYEVALEAGSKVVSRGDRLTPFQVATLKALERRLRLFNFMRFCANGVLIALGMLFLAVYFRKYHAELALSPKNILMMALPVIFALSVVLVVRNAGVERPIALFAFPAGLIGLLGVILFEARLAVLLVTMSSALLGLATGFDYTYFLIGLISGLTGVISLHSVRERREVLLAGLRLSGVNLLLAAILLVTQAQQTQIREVLLAAIANGFGCYVFAVGVLPLFESLFGITTDVRLMELTSTNHPLMRMLETAAPGSYQHVLNVTKLAEPAAEAIGANYLLVRAGAYFHDVGKALKPKYFTENQVTPEERRIHTKLSPYMSCLIIKNHVKEGIELARKYGLPEKVIDFIPQHHGTSLIKYFYYEALKRNDSPDVVVPEDEFRYPGPKPQTREAAIVMLADTVEATATARFTGRSVREEEIWRLVRDSVQEKFDDGQFDECPLTFQDLHRISEAFVRTLLSRYHKRVDYPDLGSRREVRDITTVPAETVAVTANGNGD
ncbi:MAG: HDIG domain-containing protein [Candidatus Sumerlaea chitinivorans]|uniref:HD/PDEase domain-containing protein n=1 Tax=Sumerlaea chitinivorans TaxID=2250252 RepID=A0A2Z4Y9Z5_SUMC1|nr:hypothetical protein BRCON_2856 [Candidatus Sumerlaea chitinivorans]MCX7963236.1 HDIG domain-containing protein [Candidatus Sumerlaea chitinivorans]